MRDALNIFWKICGIHSSETIFIDDAPENIQMAIKNGIDGIRFENAEQLEHELMKRGIL